MRRLVQYLSVLALFCALVPFVTACSDGGKSPVDEQECAVGEKGCQCLSDGACASALECRDDVCVPAGCQPGEQDCTCTQGGSCDTGLACEGGVCEQENVGPRPDCVELVPLRGWETEPSAIAMLFRAEDCDSYVGYGGYDREDFLIEEDGKPIPSEASRDVRKSKGLRSYVTLLLDMSSSTEANVPEIIDGAKAFVDKLLVEQNLENVYVGVTLFDGSARTHEYVRPTQDAMRVKAELDQLVDYTAPDPNSTNLNGALREGIEELQSHQQQVISVNDGGVVTTGYLMVFTDGVDTAKREDASATAQVIADARVYDPSADNVPTVQTLGVFFEGDDYNFRALNELVGSERYLFSFRDYARLEAEFAARADEIHGSIQGTYLLAYCSSARAGEHTVRLNAPEAENGVHFEFNADGFSAGCDTDFFKDTCDGRDCGGFNCGACDDETETCQISTGRCVNSCLDQDKCDGEQITNPLGYEMTCTVDGVSNCGQCVDVASNDDNCGSCGNTCSADGSSCVEGNCVCDNGGLDCDGTCINPLENDQHCGGCGNACSADGSQCDDGQCVCDGGGTLCAGQCVDTQTDADNCGTCGNVCDAVGSSCVGGTCVCDNGGVACDGSCIDEQTNVDHCGTCGNACGNNSTCATGQCVCDTGYDMCSTQCVDTTSNLDHCGSCGSSCDILCFEAACLGSVWASSWSVGGEATAMDTNDAGASAMALDPDMIGLWDATGAETWTKTVTGDSVTVDDVALGASNQMGVTGTASGTVDFGDATQTVTGVYLAKLDDAGNTTWIKGVTGTVDPAGVTITTNDDIVIAGTFNGTVNFGGGDVSTSCGALCYSFFVAAYDTNGNFAWMTRSTEYDKLGGMRQINSDGTGNLYVTGTYSEPIDWGNGPLNHVAGSEIYIAKFTPQGSLAWANGFGGSSNEQVLGLAVGASGEIAIVGHGGPSNISNNGEYFVAAFNSNGMPKWNQSGLLPVPTGPFPPPRPDSWLTDVVVLSTGHVVVSGRASSNTNPTINMGGDVLSPQGVDIVIANYDGASGAHRWSTLIGSSADETPLHLEVDSTDNLSFAVTYSSTTNFGSQSLSASHNHYIARTSSSP